MFQLAKTVHVSDRAATVIGECLYISYLDKLQA
jgi:hypothetical protein